MSEMEGAIAVAICDRDGFIIASESKEEKEGDDSVIGAISAFLDTYIDRIKNEYQTQSNFFNITSMKEKKFAYCSMGPKSILTTIAAPTTLDIELRVFSEHIAGKIELILEGNNDISIEIPEIIRVLSRSREGNLPKGTFTLKLILVGDYSVGKTSLIMRFVENRFAENYISTIGVNISKKTIVMAENTEVQLLLWDIAGQIGQMAPYRKRFYEGASAAFIVIDRTRGNYDTSIQNWFDDIKNAIPANIPIVIVGNKSDLKEQDLTTKDEIKQIAEKLGFHYILISAKTGENVNEAFLYIAYRFIERV
ncbi:MAG: GTP-binding protein [Promethearchaeota archaeon]|nr:MAG: GTP-binding protein [Candidatus Lokiarchaeota archaeon]